MRYCPKCGEEYRDDITVCAEDSTTLVNRQTYEAIMEPKPPPKDPTRLTALLSIADRFQADELAQELADEGFDVAVVSNKTPTMGSLTTPGPTLFSIVVPDNEVEKASALVAEWRRDLEGSQQQAEQAAVAEEASTEAH